MPHSTAKQIDTVGRTYAQALFEMAQASDKLDEIAGQVTDLAAVLADQPQAMQMLSSVALSSEQRNNVIEVAFKPHVDDLLYRFLCVVNDKRRFASLPGIFAAFGELMAEHRGEVNADITVARPLDAGMVEQVANRLGAVLGGRQVHLQQHVDDSLIAGFKLRIGDQLIDGSVAAQLRTIKRKIIAAGQSTN